MGWMNIQGGEVLSGFFKEGLQQGFLQLRAVSECGTQITSRQNQTEGCPAGTHLTYSDH